MPKLPGINHQRAVKAFENGGFWIVRQGKHIAMTNGEKHYYHTKSESGRRIYHGRDYQKCRPERR